MMEQPSAQPGWLLAAAFCAGSGAGGGAAALAALALALPALLEELLKPMAAGAGEGGEDVLIHTR